MDQNVLVSIIVPIYNVEKYLERCLDSLTNQTLNEIEIILVDDESPDKSKDIYNRYISKDSRFKLIQKKNGGLGFARNSGLEIAIGKYVAFIDSDDYVDLTMFECLTNFAENHKLDTVFCGYNNVHPNGRIESISEVDIEKVINSPEKVRKVLMGMIANEAGNPIERDFRMSVWHGIYSRELISTNNISFCSEREFISEDIIFHIDYLSNSTDIGILPETFYYYCYNQDSLTKTFREDRFDKSVILHKELLRRLNYLGYHKDEFKHRVDRFLLGYTRYSIIKLSQANINWAQKKMILKRICENNVWREIEDYPFNKMPIKHRLFNFMVVHKMLDPLLFISRFFN